MLMDMTDEPVESTTDDAGAAPASETPPESLDALLQPERIDELLADAEARGIEVDGPGGLLSQLTKAVLERALDAEMVDHLGSELRHRGVRDVLIVCCDGLTGLPDAITTVWPDATVQTCVVHLIRGTLRYTSWKDRKAVTAASATSTAAAAAQPAPEHPAGNKRSTRSPSTTRDAYRSSNHTMPLTQTP